MSQKRAGKELKAGKEPGKRAPKELEKSWKRAGKEPEKSLKTAGAEGVVSG